MPRGAYGFTCGPSSGRSPSGVLRRSPRAEPGTSETACKPGMVGDGIRASFTVTGASAAPKTTDESLAAATTEYQRYVASQADALPFTL